MKSQTKNKSKRRTIFSIAITVGLVSVANSAFSQQQTGRLPACPTSGSMSYANFKTTYNNSSFNTAGCSIAPLTFKVTVYKMGICSSDPIQGGSTVDLRSCFTTYNNSEGAVVDLADGSGGVSGSKNLSSNSITSRPPEGTYPYGFMIIKNSISGKMQYNIGRITYSSTNTVYRDVMFFNWANSQVANEFTSPIQFGPTTCLGGPLVDSYGSMSAIMINSNESPISTNGTVCTGTKVLVSFTPISPVILTSSSTGIKIIFAVSNAAKVLGAEGGLNDPTATPSAGLSLGAFTASFSEVR